MADEPAAGESPAAEPTGDGGTPEPSVRRPVSTDRYGFVIPESEALRDRAYETASQRAERLFLENSRLEKWRDMLRDWERFAPRNQDKIKSRCRKGVPDAVRGRVWPLLVNAGGVMRASAASYHELVRLADSSPAFADNRSTKPGGEVDRDLDRTFPRCQMFTDKDGIGQRQLRNLLVAYVVRDPEMGYFQGMNFFAALFLSYMPEEEAFWTFVAVVDNPPYSMRKLFSREPGSIACMYHQHMTECGVDVSFFSTEWFVTLFSRSFPFEMVVRVWDVFLHEGWKIVFRVAIAILRTLQPKLLKSSFEGIMAYFRTLIDHIEPRTLVDRALSERMSRAELDALAQDWVAKQATA